MWLVINAIGATTITTDSNRELDVRHANVELPRTAHSAMIILANAAASQVLQAGSAISALEDFGTTPRKDVQVIVV